MDDTIRGSVDRLDRRLHGVPCSRRFDPFVAGVRGDLSDLAFCNGSTSSVARLGARPADHIRASFAHAALCRRRRTIGSNVHLAAWRGVPLSTNVEIIH
jgi:hypothetical protein